MSKEIDEAMSLPLEQTAAFLPEALRVAITSYHAYCKEGPRDAKPKEFEEYHKGAKAAVAHIELLVKLALRAQLPEADDDTNRAAVTAALLQQAVADVNSFEN